MTQLKALRRGPAAGGAPRQLVLLCHGVGGDGHDMIELAPLWGKSLPHAVFVAPDGPQPYGEAPTGRQWFSRLDRRPAVMEAGVATARDALDAFLDAELAQQGLPADAYAMMGFSQGAMTVLYTGLRRAVAPQAILAYSGAILGAESLAVQCRHTPPVLLVHGEADTVVPVTQSHTAEKLLRLVGVPVETLYEQTLGHGMDAVGLSVGALFLQRAFAEM